ncbi:gliding motility protein GldN [Pontibacter sp. BT310]|jgi:gliding motility associated protien GldN|uniref:Gliding motility protein GldN n=1 Tax=Pontibacter populi TaxID=890055 RepID=A0ABS6X9Q9_9BACT|nr:MULTISPECIES: gliding motility protein GldN [Pontibacter]MBJ6117785.1 gliding motility protein GldN [Pontibacter sp. BT310]MBR0570211.1 gliding motility protein GldN [Microvirga sp. STS03]MBW3364637.1 gliding motility protein GldN [Pontibacter populi]
MKLVKAFGVAAGVLLSVGAMAQQVSTTATSSASARPIPEHDILFKKTVWRKIDLREKQNQPMFSQNRQITKIIIDAVKSGELTPYKTDSVNTPITREEFVGNMTPQAGGSEYSEEEIAAGLDKKAEEADPWANVAGVETAEAAGPISNEFFPKDLYLLEIKEDVVFDKKRSRMYHDIQTVSLIVPSTLSSRGFEEPIATFKMSDLVRVFRNNPETAIWYNAQNTAQHKNLADAFDLWLFSSYITKISNAGDRSLADQFGGGQKGLLAAQDAAEALIEYEYSLWSY